MEPPKEELVSAGERSPKPTTNSSLPFAFNYHKTAFWCGSGLSFLEKEFGKSLDAFMNWSTTFAFWSGIFLLLPILYGAIGWLFSNFQKMPRPHPLKFSFLFLGTVGFCSFLIYWQFLKPDITSFEKLERVHGKPFIDQAVTVDGKWIEGCYFENCTIVYNGTDTFVWQKNILTKSIRFSSTSLIGSNTLALYKSIYGGLPNSSVVEQTYPLEGK
jgi:hypothetical protein